MYSEVFVSVITGTHVACNLSLFACIAQRKSRSFIYAALVSLHLPLKFKFIYSKSHWLIGMTYNICTIYTIYICIH